MNLRTKVPAFDSSTAVHASPAAGLLRLLELDEHTPTNWPRADAAAMFQHQLAAPLELDLSGENAPGSTTVEALAELPRARRAGIRTFADLFSHAAPPLAVLKVAKDFFKRAARSQPRDSAEHRVAHACYLLSVVTARRRLDKRITNLSDTELRHNIHWALRQEWLGQAIHTLLRDAETHL